MADTPKVYVLCDANCRWEGMTKEQILAAITQAVNEGTISDIDTGFVQTIKTINGHGLKFFVGEQSEYDALTEEDKQGLFAIISNDTTKYGLLNAIETLQTEFSDVMEGKRAVPLATNATTADSATNATNATTANKASLLGYGWTSDGINSLGQIEDVDINTTYMCLISANGASYLSIIYCIPAAENKCYGTYANMGANYAYAVYDYDRRKIYVNSSDVGAKITEYCRIM